MQLLQTLRTCSNGKHPNQLCILSVPLSETDSEDRKTSLSNILHTTMLLNCEFTLGQLSQAPELKMMDLLTKIAGFVFLSAALGMMKRHFENNQLWEGIIRI